MDDKPYKPIDCTLHDRIEAHASMHEVVGIVYREGDSVVETRDRITDWFARDGAEFMRTAGGLTLRLDRIASIDGIAFTSDQP